MMEQEENIINFDEMPIRTEEQKRKSKEMMEMVSKSEKAWRKIQEESRKKEKTMTEVPVMGEKTSMNQKE